MATQALLNLKNETQDFLLCPMIDARRMEVYTAIYNKNLDIEKEISAEIISEHSFSTELTQQRIFFFGNGAAKCKSI
jgi:tRNA threonylcarbamoyladenosine biosynthesis protein TsaB